MDARVIVHPGFFTLELLTGAAVTWTEKHLPQDAEDFDGCFHVKARHMPMLLEAMKEDGLAFHVMM